MKKYFPSHNAHQFPFPHVHITHFCSSIWKHTNIYTFVTYLYLHTGTTAFFWEFNHHLAHDGAQIRKMYSVVLTYAIKCRKCNLLHTFLICHPCHDKVILLYFTKRILQLTPFSSCILTAICHAYLSTHIHQTVQPGLWQLTKNSQHIQAKLKYLHNSYTTQN
jgi:hypothetical protein